MALVGWRVLELADGPAAAFCTKVLSDLGADVVMVEPRSGHASRRWAPRRADAEPDEPGGRFLYLGTGKASVGLDDGPAGIDRLRKLVATADVVVTDHDARRLDSVGPLSETCILAAVRPFGSSGPYEHFRAHHLIEFHAGGEGSILPSGLGWKLFPDRPPLQIGGDIAASDAGWNTAVAVLAACYDRLRTGRGQRIDVSAQESQLTLNRTRLSRFSNDGVRLRREGNRYGFAGMMECCDGWVQLVGITDRQMDALAASPAAGELADPQFATAEARAADPGATGAALAAWCRARAKVDVVAVLAALGCPVGAYAAPADILVSEQLSHRGFFQKIDDGRGGSLRVPGAPYQLSRTPVVVRPAPALGSANGFREPAVRKPELEPGRALEGVRVLDFTWAAAGPYATLLLALLGAEVVKVESTRRPDPARRGFFADYGGIDQSPNFNELNCNKRSFQVDLTTSEGRELVHGLVPWADVVIDNFRPGVMARFGLDAASLLERHPGLVVVSSSANGSTGPEAMAAGLASIFGATGGLSHQTGYPDGPPTEVGESTDYRSANALAVAVLAALLHRARTGEGQHVDVASREVVIASAPDALLAHELGVAWEPRVGNTHRDMAPHDVYPAKGDDEWVAVAVGSDGEWQALCTILEGADWATLHRSSEHRRAAASDIDAAIAAWTRERPAREASETLQAAGVPAMAVMTNEALATDPHLVARGMFVEVEHPEIGRTRVLRAPWLFSDLDCAITRHGPLMGQDNAYALEHLLGLSLDQRAALLEVLV